MMRKLWQVAVYEYQCNVFKKSFILVLLSVPLMVALNIGVGLVIANLQDNDLPVGYVDQAGVFAQVRSAPQLSGSDQAVVFIPFASESEARAALLAEKIQAYYLLPADYFEKRALELVYSEKPGENATRQFYDFLQFNLLSAEPLETAQRAAAGTAVTVRSLDGRRVIPSDGPSFGILMPLLINIAFLGLLLMSSGYLMSAVTEEKENRTMEILATSASPLQIIGGKLLGIIGIGFSVLLTWLLVIVVGVLVAVQSGIGWFQNLAMDWSSIVAAAAIAIPAYFLAAALMTAIGAMSTSTQEGQSLSSIFVILHAAPLYVSAVFFNDPHSPLAVALSIMPFTALMTVAMRNMFTIVPDWQIAVSACVQVLCALGALWLASRAFRLGMLRYGQRLTWRSLFERGRSDKLQEGRTHA